MMERCHEFYGKLMVGKNGGKMTGDVTGSSPCAPRVPGSWH